MELNSDSRVVIIMRGVPGAGKSTCSEALSDYLSLAEETSRVGVTVCSADHFMVNKRGQYHFIPKNIPRVHAKCQEKFRQALESHQQVIIVDNTNIKVKDFQFYIDKAMGAGYEVFQWEVASSFTSAHNVPPAAIERMRCGYEPISLDNFEPPHAFHDFFHQRIEAKMEEDSLAIDSIHVKL